jgi:SAM-dependent methyltransferase
VQVLHENARVLDVGCGSGYLATCFARLIELGSNTGVTYGVDYIEELVAISRTCVAFPLHSPAIARSHTYSQQNTPNCCEHSNIMKADSDLLEEGKVQLTTANGWDVSFANPVRVTAEH